MRLAGLAPGSTTVNCAANADYWPKNANGGQIGVQSNTAHFATITGAMNGTYIICSKNILGQFVLQLDATMDDGDPGTGSMRAILQSAVAARRHDGHGTGRSGGYLHGVHEHLTSFPRRNKIARLARAIFFSALQQEHLGRDQIFLAAAQHQDVALGQDRLRLRGRIANVVSPNAVISTCSRPSWSSRRVFPTAAEPGGRITECNRGCSRSFSSSTSSVTP